MVEAIRVQKDIEGLKDLKRGVQAFKAEDAPFDPSRLIDADRNPDGSFTVTPQDPDAPFDPSRLIDATRVDLEQPAGDIPPLTDYLRFKYAKGFLPLVRGSFGREAMFGRMDSQEALDKGNQAYLEQLDKAGRLRDVTFKEAPMRAMLGEAAEMLPFMLSSIQEGLKTGLALGGGWAIIVGVAGQVGPQIAAPEELITVPGAFAAGMSTGMAFGVITNAMNVEGGNLFLDLIEKEITPETARPLALGAGLAIGIIEMTELALFAAPFKRAFGKMIRDGVSRGALIIMASQYFKTLGIQVAQEELQEIVTIATEMMAGAIEDNPNVIPNAEEIRERLVQTAVKSAQGLAVLGAPGAVVSGVSAKADLNAKQRLEIVKKAVSKTETEKLERGVKEAVGKKEGELELTERERKIQEEIKERPKAIEFEEGVFEKIADGTKEEFEKEFVFHSPKSEFIADNIRKEGIQEGSFFADNPLATLPFGEDTKTVFAVRRKDLELIKADPKDIFGVEFADVAGIFFRSGKAHKPVFQIPRGAAHNVFDFIKNQVKEIQDVTQKEEAKTKDTEVLKEQEAEAKRTPEQRAERKEAISKAAEKKEIEAQIVEIETDGKQLIVDTPILDRDVGEVETDLNFADRAQTTISKAILFAKQKFIAITPMNIVFDLMSKAKPGKGAVFQIFKRPIDIKHNKYLEQRKSIMVPIRELLTKLNLKESNLERILVWATLQQENGRLKLSTIFTQDALNRFIQKGLSKEEQTMLDAMRKHFERLKPQLIKVMKDVYGKEFKEVEDFFPMLTDFEAMESSEIQEMFGSSAPLIGLVSPAKKETKVKGAPSKFLEERKGGANKIVLNALAVFSRHVDNATYLINMAETINNLQKIAANKKFAKVVGTFGQEVTESWLNMMAKKGGLDTKRIRALDWLRDNAGMAILGYKFTTILIQPTALLDAAALIGGQAAFRGAYNYLLDPDWRLFFRTNFTEVLNRTGDDIGFARIAEDRVDPTLLIKVKQGAFWAIRTLDGITAAAVAIGAYEKFVLEKGGVVDFSKPDIDAIIEAESIVNRSQASALFKDAPAALSQGRFFGNQSVDRAFFQFQTFALGRFSIITSALSQQESIFKPTQHTLNVAIYLTLAAMAATTVRVAVDELISIGDDDDETIKENAVKRFTREMLSTVPIIPTIISPLVYRTTSIPSIDMVVDSLARLNVARKAKDGEKVIKAARAIIKLAGISGKLPGAIQIDEIVEKIFLPEKSKKKTTSTLRRF